MVLADYRLRLLHGQTIWKLLLLCDEKQLGDSLKGYTNE
jgi:hypothetical protein